MTAATPIAYAIDAPAVNHQWMKHSAYDFETTMSKLKDAIAASDLWLIHEIDPRMLLERAGFAIQPVRQLLFFHPRYMEKLLQADARAVPEVPIKIVVMADSAGHVVVRGTDLRFSFSRYANARLLGEELEELCAGIVATVAVPESISNAIID
jgi:uncharacterized protein (DUF302 family)